MFSQSFDPLKRWININRPDLREKLCFMSQNQVREALNKETGLDEKGSALIKDSVPKYIAALTLIKALNPHAMRNESGARKLVRRVL